MHCSRREVAGPVDIRNQPRLLRLPTQLLPSALNRCLVVDCCEMREPAKVLAYLLSGLADDRQVQTAADNASDLGTAHPLPRSHDIGFPPNPSQVRADKDEQHRTGAPRAS